MEPGYETMTYVAPDGHLKLHVNYTRKRKLADEASSARDPIREEIPPNEDEFIKQNGIKSLYR